MDFDALSKSNFYWEVCDISGYVYMRISFTRSYEL